MPKLQGRRESIWIQKSQVMPIKRSMAPSFSLVLYSQCSDASWDKQGVCSDGGSRPSQPQMTSQKVQLAHLLASTCIWTPDEPQCWSSQFRLLQADFSSVSLPKNLLLIKRQESVPKKIFTARYTDLVTGGCAWESGPIHTFPIMLILKHASTHIL